MRVWIASFLVLFGMAELYQWVKHFTLPLPVYILGGAFLAIASNYDRRAGFPFQQSDDIKGQTPPVMPSVNSPHFSHLSQSQSKLAGQPTSSNIQPPRPISFTIRPATKKTTQE